MWGRARARLRHGRLRVAGAARPTRGGLGQQPLQLGVRRAEQLLQHAAQRIVAAADRAARGWRVDAAAAPMLGRRHDRPVGRPPPVELALALLLLLEVELLVLVVERVLPQHLLGHLVHVVQIAVGRLALVPPLRVVRLQCLIRDPQQPDVLAEIHAEIDGVLEDVLRRARAQVR